MALQSRREFLSRASGALAAVALSALGCRSPESREEPAARFPILEASGSPREIGLAIGRRFGEQIREGLRRRSAWFEELRRFMEQDRASRYEPFLAAGKTHFPEVMEELRGWSEGSGVPFDDLMTLNLKAELAAMMHGESSELSGCSTIVLSHGERRIIAHNEDGHGAYHDLMFLVRVSQPGKPGFLCLTYPGILCGNGPAVNEAGIVLTTNYIASLEVRPGVPRYLISRAILEATSLDEAVDIATHPRRAFAFHYNLGSSAQGRVLSVETTAERSAVHEVEGLYMHTNHLLLPGIFESPQDREYVESSSMSRYRVLRAGVRRLHERLDDIQGMELVELLSSHESAPYSPCRHPSGEVPYSPCRHPSGEIGGATLGNALFDLGSRSLLLTHSNPCGGRALPYDFPA
jgi:hypothetical protein